MTADAGPETLVAEVRRQVGICYARRYCAVFLAITSRTAFADGDLTQLANLCRNCRGSYCACRYSPPHERAQNLPQVLAKLRQDSRIRSAWPAGLAGAFQISGLAIALALGFRALAALSGVGEGFYAALGDGAMLAVLTPAFLFPLVALGVGLSRFRRETGGHPVTLGDRRDAGTAMARLRNLSGGQRQGRGYEREERYSDARCWAHRATMCGVLLCFSDTCAGTVPQYPLAWPAPRPLWAPPKLLAIPGEVLLVAGIGGHAWLGTSADCDPGVRRAWGGEMAFVLLLGFTGLSWLRFYAATGARAAAALFASHLAAVTTLSLLTPPSKIAHPAYRFEARVRDAQGKRSRRKAGAERRE